MSGGPGLKGQLGQRLHVCLEPCRAKRRRQSLTLVVCETRSVGKSQEVLVGAWRMAAHAVSRLCYPMGDEALLPDSTCTFHDGPG